MEGVLQQGKERIAGHDSAGLPVTRNYLIFLMLVATGGWALSAYDFNLQVMSLMNIPLTERGSGRFLKKAAQKFLLCWVPWALLWTTPMAQHKKVFLLLFVHKK